MFADGGLSALQWTAVGGYLVLWLVIGWGDYTHQKIKRRLMVYGTIGVAAGYAFLLALTILGLKGLVLKFPFLAFYKMVATDVVLCGFAAVLLWWLGVWPAGDAKLFILLAAFYPLMNVTRPGHYERLFLSALINTFLPASLFVFLRSAHYVYTSRFRHQVTFLKQLGWRRDLAFFGQKTLESLRALLGALPAKLKEAWSGVRADPKAMLSSVWSWLVSMLAMSLLSCYLTGFMSSPLRMTLLFSGLFIAWRRVVGLLGPGARYVAVAAVAWLLVTHPPGDWRHFTVVFQNLTVFSFFMFLGMNFAMKLIAGGEGLPFLIPFLFPFAGIAVGEAWSFVSNALREAADAAGRVRGGGPSLNALRGAAPAASRVGSSARVFYFSVHDLVGGFNMGSMASTLFVLASMGLFFGLSLVLVRLWDREERPVRSSETLTAYVLLAPAFVERLRLDPEFYETHFQKLYPDGLTRDQADALKGWCRERAIEEIPLAPTISFAAWIFLGFFLAHLLGGGHVLEALW